MHATSFFYRRRPEAVINKKKAFVRNVNTISVRGFNTFPRVIPFRITQFLKLFVLFVCMDYLGYYRHMVKMS